VHRRAFLGSVVGGLLTAPLAAEAQPGKAFRIGILGTSPSTNPAAARLWGVFFQRLRELGYVEGQNLTIERRFSEGKAERLPGLAADLVRLKVDVIVAASGPAPLAAQSVTKTIPIVMTNQADPVASGLVASLARPGGNITGLSLLSAEIVGKQLALLKEAIPRVSRVAVLRNPTNKDHALLLKEVEVAANVLASGLFTFPPEDRPTHWPDSKLILSMVPGRSALTVTPCTAAMVPITLKVEGHFSCLTTIVVTATGGTWKAAPAAIAA